MPLPTFRSAPVAHPDAILTGERWRITVLTEGLVRIESAPDGVFEDRATTFAVNRDLPVPEFTVKGRAGKIEITTDRLKLFYDGQEFTPAGLAVKVLRGGGHLDDVWRFGADVRDLGGTVRTLDGKDGRVPLEPGVISRSGYAMVDDSGSSVFEPDGSFAPPRKDHIDLYVFAYGNDYEEALQAFHAVSGLPPVLPRWVFGNWWSRYYPYGADEYLELMDRFAADGIPLSVAVIDMDWHLVDIDPKSGPGWTGYSWNRDLFPDPVQFLAALHRRGLHVSLNMHPHDGVRSFEEPYPAMAEALGLDPARGTPIPFDAADPEFMVAYLSALHHPLEEQGVDFWWIDWQSGPHSTVPGIDPLWVLNHYHFLDSGRAGRRPLTFSRYAGPGSHRYPIGFSGDTIITWDSLDFQPELTATAANIGYGWWSHDIGGHFHGIHDPELMVRWTQLGVFSPIMRLHSASHPFLRREPWSFDPATQSLMASALRLRHRLIPYLHTMNHRAAHGVPLVRPMYHLHPDAAEAYEVRNQFAFGSELLVSPVTTPLDTISRTGRARTWLPAGQWIDIFTGVVYEGNQTLELHRSLEVVPVLLKAGGILPLADPTETDATRNPDQLELLVAPGANGTFTIVEDDGTGNTLDTIRTAGTTITWNDHRRRLTINAVDGALGVVPERRTWTITLLGVIRSGACTVNGDVHDVRPSPDRVSLTVANAPTDDTVQIAFDSLPRPVTSDLASRLYELLQGARWDNDAKATAWAGLQSPAAPERMLAELHARNTPSALFGAITELLASRHQI